jgi:hypothetical protein
MTKKKTEHWISITEAEAKLIHDKGLTWASDSILSRLGVENTHYIGDYDLKQHVVALIHERECEYRYE